MFYSSTVSVRRYRFLLFIVSAPKKSFKIINDKLNKNSARHDEFVAQRNFSIQKSRSGNSNYMKLSESDADFVKENKKVFEKFNKACLQKINTRKQHSRDFFPQSFENSTNHASKWKQLDIELESVWLQQMKDAYKKLHLTSSTSIQVTFSWRGAPYQNISLDKNKKRLDIINLFQKLTNFLHLMRLVRNSGEFQNLKLPSLMKKVFELLLELTQF